VPDKPRHPALHIVAYMDSLPSKKILVDNRSVINVISSIVLERLKVLIRILNASNLTIMAFNNTLATTMGIIILLVKVGVREITSTYHVVEGDMHYNLLLDQPLIEYMESIPSILHICLKYLHNGMVYYIIGNHNPFNHYNFTFLPKSP